MVDIQTVNKSKKHLKEKEKKIPSSGTVEFLS
jgi:hypothetical protein